MTPRISLLVLAGVAMAACSDTTPTAPDVRPPLPRYSFSDGARGGNPDFFFLFPLGIFPSKSPHWDAGKADPDMKLVRVEICELPQCTTVIQEFDADDITVVRPGQHASDEKDENYFPAREAFYRVIWRTARAGIDPAKFYRIRVLVGHIELGFVDVDPVQTLRQLAQVDRTRYAGVLLGLPFPIRFRIEQGALCENNAVCATSFVDRDVGGTFYAPDEGAAVNFGPGDLPEDVMVTIERVPVPPGAPCVTDPSVIGAILQQWEGCYRITTAPDVTLTGDVELAVCLEPGIPEEVHHNLLLYKFDDDQGLQRPDPIEPPFPFSCEGFSGTPAGPFGFFLRGLDQFARALSRVVSPKPLYAVDGGLGCILRIGDSFSTFFWGLGVNARAFGGTSDDLEVPAGDAVPNAPSVRVTSAHSDMIGTPLPMPGVPVTFQVVGSLGELRSASGATVSSIQVMTNSLGIAALPAGAWVTSATVGAHTLRATGPFLEGPVDFTAIAVERRVISSIPCPPTVPPNHTTVFCFNFTTMPGVWHGFVVGRSIQPFTSGDVGQLSADYVLVSPTGLDRIVAGAPVDIARGGYTFQSEFNGTLWNDVLRIMTPAGDPAYTLTVSVVRRVSFFSVRNDFISGVHLEPGGGLLPGQSVVINSPGPLTVRVWDCGEPGASGCIMDPYVLTPGRAYRVIQHPSGPVNNLIIVEQ